MSDVALNGAPWVVAGGKVGELGHCRRCGAGLRMTLPQPVDTVVFALDGFNAKHARCEEQGYTEPTPKTLEEWMQSRDTGRSSMSIARVYKGDWQRAAIVGLDVPHDGADFGRCYRLLKMFPQVREAFPKLAELCPTWKPFVEHWDLLTKTFESEPEKMYVLIQSLILSESTR
jgi:hypothetical protein